MALRSKVFAGFLKRAARGLAIAVLALLVLLVLVVLGINTPWGRGQLLTAVNAAIADQFQGSLRLKRVGHVGLWGVSGVDAVVLDSAGRVVIDANSIDVRIGLVPLAWDLLAADADTDHIAIERVEMRHARVRLIDSGDGTPTLARAFTSRSPAAPSKKTTTLNIAHVHFGHVWAHGTASGTAIDADVTELNGKLGLTPALFRLAIASAEIHSRALPVRVDPRGKLAGTLEVPLKATGGMNASVRFDGNAWESPSRARARLEGRSISANVVLDSVQPEQLRRVLPASKLRAPVALALNLKGTFDRPELSVRARLGAGRVEAELALDNAARSASATARTHDLDASLLDAGLPASALSITASAKGGCTEAWRCSLDYQVGLADSEVAGTSLPVSRAQGSFERDDSGALGTRGKLWIEERGAPTELDYDVQSSGGAPTLLVVGTTEFQQPPRLQHWVPDLALRGRLWTEVWVDLGSRRLRLNVKANLPELQSKAVHARLVQIDARAEGDLEAPQLRIAARFESLAVARRVYREGSVQVSGTPERAHVTAHTGAPQQLDLDTWVTLTPSVSLRDLELDAGSGDEAVALRAQSLSFANGRFVGKNVKLETKSGWARVSFDHGPKLRHLSLEAREFDARRAAAPWQLEEFVPHALLTADGTFDQEPEGAVGHLEASVKRFSHGPVKNAAVSVSARLARGLLRGSVDARWKDSAANVNVDELPLAALPPSTPAALSGRVNGSVRLALADLEPLFKRGRVPLETASGEAELTFRIERENKAPARLEAQLETSRLRLVGERKQLAEASAESARQAAPWSITGTDVAGRVVLDQATRELSLDATVRDDKGKLAVVTTDIVWPSEAAQLELSEWPALWQRARVNAGLWLLPRRLSELPAPIAVTDVEGLASLSLHAAGTYQDPTLRFMAQVRDLGPPEEGSRRVDVSASGDYRRAGGSARVAADAGGKRAAEVHAEWRGDPVGYLAHRNAPPELEVRGRLNRFPVSAVPLLTSQRVAGHVSGAFEVEGGEPGWQGQVRLDSNDLSVARVTAEQLRLRAELSATGFDAALRASGAALGSLEAEVSGPPPFTRTPLNNPLRAKLSARNFQLKTLEPLMSGSVSAIEGVVNAELTGNLSRDKPELTGHLELSEGAAQLPALGQTLHDIEARVRAGKNRIDLSHFVAHGLTGKLRARGSATLQGLALSSAQARVDVAERDKIPLTVQGVSMGDAWGQASVQYRSINERRSRLDVDVRRFHLELPDVSPPGVQNLDPAPDIRVGHATRTGKFVDIPLQPIEREEEDGAPQRWIIALDLGDIEIRKGSGIRIGLEGNVKARIGRKTRLDGRIDLTGGTLDVSGKEFKIERGSVTFDRSLPSDGVVTATARWDSPAEYTVYAEYSGTVEQGELRLRSEPPLTQDEVLGLIMFGTPGGTFGAKKKSEAATAVGIAGGTVARGLNRALSDISQLDVSTRVDTSTGEARPELVMQVTPRATARVTQALGEAPPGQSPDRTFLTVDLRLFTRWSLSAQVGDEGGSSLDLIWRHRY